jgi:hypothetical protein
VTRPEDDFDRLCSLIKDIVGDWAPAAERHVISTLDAHTAEMARLRAAVALHGAAEGYDGTLVCQGCGMTWPCPTVRVAEGEL